MFGLFTNLHTSGLLCIVIHFMRGGSDGTASKEEPGWRRMFESWNNLPGNLGSRILLFPIHSLSFVMSVLPRNLMNSETI